jgi:hypothetical protein
MRPIDPTRIYTPAVLQNRRFVTPVEKVGLTLHIERSSFANWNGTDQQRLIASLTATDLKYTNPAASTGGTAELGWKRVK